MHPENSQFFPLSLGTAGFGTAVARDNSFKILDAFFSIGGNLIDTAAVYGMGLSEQTIGAWMRDRGVRDRVHISTKGGHPSLPDWSRRINEAEIRSDMVDSLRNLGTDCVDIYFLHRDDESQPVEAIMPILNKLVCEGKTRLIGASNWTVARIDEANAFARKNGMAEFSVSQIFWNGAVINKEGIYDPTLVAMDEAQHTGYAKNRMPVMAYTSQAQGLFSHIRDRGYEGISEGLTRTYINPATKSRAERILSLAQKTKLSPTAISLAYLLCDKEVKAYPILGISRVERLAEAMQVFALQEQDLTVLLDE